MTTLLEKTLARGCKPGICRCSDCKLHQALDLIEDTSRRLQAIDHMLGGRQCEQWPTSEVLLANRLVWDAEHFIAEMTEGWRYDDAASEVR